MTDRAAASSAPASPSAAAHAPRAAGPDPAALRAQYGADGLLEAELPGTPMEQFAIWFAQALAAAEAGVLHEPNAMVVSTADADGRPSSRTVLMKGYDRHGFVFFTNYESRKARELAANPNVALLFPWHPVARQIIVTGTAERVGREETIAYFRSRPHGSQLGAWASAQSSVIAGREELDRAYADLAARYPEGEQVPAPPHWGGFRVEPQAVEFWQGRANRLHDRLRYVRADAEADPGSATGWTLERLSP
ncbi:pyridoxamine 5'-phosphate oxidase [Streptomyces sp. NBC_01381]|uniref:pyridoxamine 5'-phosphate oxidase n=1 Tax=Streptomyces sp. NBC_01381 TaxID=2903845 RepID=UPI002257DA8C|nr:pyridoxamine 5'-phosphate oxidase [Streptomyces sp. NBC_01381]MCX4666282.1 pyridoxamine 5'-phosphate oxidase [Streptomyces sp. NBC_01381]